MLSNLENISNISFDSENIHLHIDSTVTHSIHNCIISNFARTYNRKISILLEYINIIDRLYSWSNHLHLYYFHHHIVLQATKSHLSNRLHIDYWIFHNHHHMISMYHRSNKILLHTHIYHLIKFCYTNKISNYPNCMCYIIYHKLNI